MHNNKLLLCLTLLSPFLLSAETGPTFTLNTNLLGPFDVYQDDYVIDVSIKNNSIKNKTICLYLFTYDHNDEPRENANSGFLSIKSSRTKSISLKVSSHLFFDEYGCTYRYILKDDNGTTFYDKSIKLYPKNSNRYNVALYKDSPITSQNIAYQIVNNWIYSYNEKFLFNSDYQYFMMDYYYRLSLDQFTFSYDFFLPLSYVSASLYISNALDCFKNLEINESNKVVVPLKIYYQDGFYRFLYEHTMYVNPLTFDMSYIPLKDYVATNYLFLPKNRANDVLNMTFSFEIIGLGQSNNDFFWSTSFIIERFIIGPCDSSDYCVVGGIKK